MVIIITCTCQYLDVYKILFGDILPQYTLYEGGQALLKSGT